MSEAVTAAAIEARSLSKRYGERDALRSVDLRIEAGTVTAVFGHNGSGKTTFLKLVASLLKPTEGSLEVAGLDLARRARDVRGRVGLLLDLPFLPPRFSIEEGLHYYADMRGITLDRDRAVDILDRVGLKRRRLDPLNTFSRGMAQRVGIACVMVADPELVLLDEPYTGLDPEGCDLVDALIDEFRSRGRSVLLVTHELQRGIRQADRVVVFARGKLIHDSPAEATTVAQVLEVM